MRKRRLGVKKLLFRIFATFFLTTLVILSGLFLLAHSLKPEHQLSGMSEKNAVFYLESLQQKLNHSLSENGIRQLYDDLHLRARVAGFEDLADQQGLPSFAAIAKEDDRLSSKITLGKHAGYFFAELKGAQPRTAWFIAQSDIPRFFAFPFIGIAGFILLILILSFLTIRWMMSPMKVIIQGVNKISTGDLKYRIQTRHTDEFQLIAEAFNNMADGLEKMIVSKERLLRDVSHELRSPLTRVGVAADLMKDDALKESVKEDLRKMEGLVSEILESYRLKEGATSLRKSPTPLKELIEAVVADYESTSPGVKAVNLPDVVLNVDGMQIERVLRNLIENSIKYAKPDSKATTVTLEKDRQHWVLKVKDDGIGISKQDLPHIFEPFYRADTVRSPGTSGFGLGLSIAHSIAIAHDGELSVSSQQGKGAEFTLKLPDSSN